jgi:hypothetical protein
MNIIWFARHEPLPAQRRELERLFPDHRLIIEADIYRSAEDIVERFNRLKGNEMVVIAPLSLVGKLIDLGLRPLWAELREVDAAYASKHPDRCVPAPRGRFQEFTRFRRLIGIELKFGDLE